MDLTPSTESPSGNVPRYLLLLFKKKLYFILAYIFRGWGRYRRHEARSAVREAEVASWTDWPGYFCAEVASMDDLSLLWHWLPLSNACLVPATLGISQPFLRSITAISQKWYFQNLIAKEMLLERE